MRRGVLTALWPGAAARTTVSLRFSPDLYPELSPACPCPARHPSPGHPPASRLTSSSVCPNQAFSSLDFPSSVSGSFSCVGVKLPPPFAHPPRLSPPFPHSVSAAAPPASIFPLASSFPLAHCLVTPVQTLVILFKLPLPSAPPAVTLPRGWIRLYEAEFRALQRFVKANTEADTASPDIHDLPRPSPARPASSLPRPSAHPAYSSPTRPPTCHLAGTSCF